MTWTFLVIAAFALGILLGAVALWSARFPLRRPIRLLLLAAALLATTAPGVAWAWARTNAPPPLSRAEQILAEVYRGKYGGLTIHHSFGEGKSIYNPPDILEAGGFIRDVRLTPVGSQIDSFSLLTLQGKRLQFLVRPEIVPINSDLWNVEHFLIYSQCRCMVALHFTQQPVGNVVIIVFAVEQKELE
ncbi:MAG: hypothetical protein HY681_09915 [Chloroflexi bacterium]|nr:hypothetical protein [Chloroflexota bacterium]